MDATITDVESQETDQFPWGAIKWLCNDQIDPEAEMTFGTVYINAGQSNPLHYHPNCEELIYIISGECDHTLDGKVYPMKPGMMMRIPQDAKHKAANTGWAPVMMVICYSSADRQTGMGEEGQE